MRLGGFKEEHFSFFKRSGKKGLKGTRNEKTDALLLLGNSAVDILSGSSILLQFVLDTNSNLGSFNNYMDQYMDKSQKPQSNVSLILNLELGLTLVTPIHKKKKVSK